MKSPIKVNLTLYVHSPPPRLCSRPDDADRRLKRSRVEPPVIVRALRGHGGRLEDLGRLYVAYQDALVRLQWADSEGLGWLAAEALWHNPRLAAGLSLIVVDGFDSFTPTQLDTLHALSGRSGDIFVTLAGEQDMSRKAYRRFARTLERIQAVMSVSVESLPRRPISSVGARPHRTEFVSHRFTTGRSRTNIQLIEAQTQALEAREALRWIKARIERDHVRPDQCAVIARDLTPYRQHLGLVGQEFGLPFLLAGRATPSKSCDCRHSQTVGFVSTSVGAPPAGRCAAVAYIDLTKSSCRLVTRGVSTRWHSGQA